MDILHAVILGVVEGLTEFLPISSTGHMILVSELLHIPETEFLKSFEIVIQLGAILAVVLLYWRKLLLDWELMKRVAVAFVPTGIIAFFFYGTIKSLLGSPLVVVLALGIGGIILILFERHHREPEGASEDLSVMPYMKAVKIGLFQAISIIPGVSRSGATIVGGMLLGMSRERIVEFSFLLAVPTMAAATGYDLLKNASAFSTSDTAALLVGFAVSFFVALLAVKLFLSFVRTHTFVPFGIYRIALALVFLLFVL